MAPDFVEKFYAQSRLHHLSTWKQELRTIMQPIRAQLATKRRLPPNSKRPRVIMHVDMDCFFASVALRDRPHLQDQPVGISHATGHGGVEAASATADVASCNYVARKFGVRNGMSLGKARARCPELIVLPYEFDKYRAVSEQFYAALVGFADDIHDEAYLDVTSFVHAPGDEVKHAEAIRAAIVAATRCVASVGVSSNMLLARMATTKAKPNGSFLLRSEDAQTVLDACAVGDLPGVGWVLRERLQKKSVATCQDLRGLSKAALMAEVGDKTGEMLYNYCRGRDDRKLNEAVKARQSVSTEISWGIRFQSQEQLETFMRGLSDEIHRRLVQADSRTRHITVKVMQRKVEVNKYYKHLGHGPCDNYSKSTALATATDAIDVIYRESLAMINSFSIPPSELRGIGIQCTKLVPATEADTQQRSLFEFAKPAPVTPRLEAREEAAPSPDIARTRPRPPPVHDDGGSSRLNVHDGDTVEEEEATAVNTQQSDVFDVDVYKQLPDDIQQELASQYRRAKGKHKQTVAVPAVIDTIQTQSHIAYEVLDALPPSLQAEITEEYNLTSPNKADIELPLQPPVPEEEEELVQGTPLLPRVPNARLPTGTTLTQMWDQRQRSKTVLAPWESSLDFERIYTHLDSEVLDALPEEIRAEVLREQRMFVLPTRANKAWRGASTGRVSRLRHHSNHGGVGRTGPAKVVSTTTTTRIQPAATVPAPAAAHGPTSIPPQGIVPAASTGEPCLLGKSSLADVRSLLTEWIIAHQDSDAPLDEDLVMVLEYVRQLVAAKNLEMTELVVQWIDLEVRRRQRRKRMTADDGWMQAVETVRDVAAQEVKRAYKAKLSIDI
ncbi:deoxycytidyl transferase [Sorochytrium milnesiophthora]